MKCRQISNDIVNGVPENKNANCAILIKNIGKELNILVNINGSMINDCHRVGFNYVMNTNNFRITKTKIIYLKLDNQLEISLIDI